MIDLIEYGYLETPYLSEFPYLVGATEQGLAAQTTFAIIDEHEIALQTKFQIVAEKPNAFQFEGHIEGFERFLAGQTQFRIDTEKAIAAQFQGQIDSEQSFAAQSLLSVITEQVKGSQFEAKITKEHSAGVQANSLLVGKEKSNGLSFHQSKSLPHLICYGDGYLNDEPYLTLYPYLQSFFCVPMGLQFQSVQENAKATQFRAVLYNTTNLRILVDFPSRGTSGTNWTATTTEPSSTNSFSVNNVNTDIVEQYWRSETGELSATLVCDTELTQGVYLDTLAILNHNFSGSASIILQGSNDPSFGTIPVSITLNYEPVNMYYIAPELPLISYRYWRLNINDAGSADNFLRIGTIVFGSAVIFTQECFVDQVQFGQRHFVDKVYTEGFTNVSNDRGKKKYLNLEFRNLAYGRANFQNMREIFDYAGTTLKCLYIPTPQYPSRFAIFAKMNEIPAETHNYKGANADYVDFSLNVDESL